MDKYLEAEKELAELLGWTNIYNMNGYLIGTEKVYDDFEQSVPYWCRDSEAAFELMVEHLQSVDVQGETGVVWAYSEVYFNKIHIADHPSKQAAVRYAIVMAAIQKLKGNA